MGYWTQIHFLGLGLEIAAALVGGALPLIWVRVRDGHLEFNPERLKAAKLMGTIVLWALAVGFTLELAYEAHLLTIY